MACGGKAPVSGQKGFGDGLTQRVGHWANALNMYASCSANIAPAELPPKNILPGFMPKVLPLAASFINQRTLLRPVDNGFYNCAYKHCASLQHARAGW